MKSQLASCVTGGRSHLSKDADKVAPGVQNIAMILATLT